MSARSDLLLELDSLRRAVDLPILVDGSVDAPIARRLIAGVSVTAFITVEEFVRRRLEELAAFVSAGSTQFSELSEGVRSLLLIRTARNFHAGIQRKDNNETQRLLLAGTTGRSLLTFGAGSLNVASMTLAWAGSNLQESDVEEVLKILGCKDRHWEALTVVLKRGLRQSRAFPVRDQFDLLARSRHSAAHSALASATVTELRTLPRAASWFCFALDCMASHLALELQRGRAPSIPSTVHTLVKFRYVEKMGAYWRHIGEGQRRGSRYRTRREVWAKARAAARSGEETIVELDSSGLPVDWLPIFCP
jgi:hypothetical protein